MFIIRILLFPFKFNKYEKGPAHLIFDSLIKEEGIILELDEFLPLSSRSLLLVY